MSKLFSTAEFRQLEASWAEGTADPNTAALARDAGSIYHRAGNYPSVPTELYIKLGGGAAGKGWGKQNLVNLKIYNITDPAYGAVGDGVTDCRAAIVAAATAANAAGGGIVYFPAAVLGYAVHINPSPSASGCIELSNFHNIFFMGDGHNSWLKMAGDYLGHTQFLFRVYNGSSRINFFNFRCNGQSIVNPNNVDQNHFIQVSSDTTDPAGPPSDVDVCRMWFDPIVGCALRVLGEGLLNGRLVSDVRFFYNACNLGDGATMGRSVVEANRNSSRILLHYNWMGPVSPIQGGQNIDFEPAGATAPERWSIIGNIVVSNNGFSVTLSGVDSPRDSPIKNSFLYNVVIGTPGIVEAVAQPTFLAIVGNVITSLGAQPAPTTAVIALRNLTESLISENVVISVNPGIVADRLGIWLFGDPPGNPSQLTISDNLWDVVGGTGNPLIKFDTTNQIVFSDNLVFVDTSAVTSSAAVAMRAISVPGQDWVVRCNLLLATAGVFTQGILLECGGSNDVHNALCDHNIAGHSTYGMLWDTTTFQMLDWRGCNGNIFESTAAQQIAFPTTLVGVTCEGTAGSNPQFALSQAAMAGNVKAGVGSVGINTITGTVGNVLSIKESGGATTAGWVGDGPDVLEFGVLTLNATTTSQFIAPGMALPTESATEIQVAIPRPGTLRNMQLHCTAGTGGGNNTFTLQVNGVDTLLSLTAANTAVIGTGTTNQISVNAGALISIRTSKTLAPGTPQTNVVLSFEITS